MTTFSHSLFPDEPCKTLKQTLILGADSSLADEFYLGIRDHIAEGVWKTAQSEYKCGVRFTNWRTSTEPKGGSGENCALLQKSWGGKWLDFYCSSRQQSLCQIFE